MINEISAMYGDPDDIAKKIEELRDAGVGYVLINGGGSGDGARGREGLRRFARDVIPMFADEQPKPRPDVTGCSAPSTREDGR